MNGKCNGKHFKADVHLPLEEGDGEDELTSEDDPSSSVDWATVFELSILCPMTFYPPGDEDLDRIYVQCRNGCPLQGRAFF